jgi:Proteins of 100 residues with WXG
MSIPTQVEQLRNRARHLRSISTMIGTSHALSAHTLAGPDTWVGPTAQACLDALLTLRRQMQTSQQSLTDAARGLERRADALATQPATTSAAT